MHVVPDPFPPSEPSLLDRVGRIERGETEWQRQIRAATVTCATELAGIRSEVRFALTWRPVLATVAAAFLGAGAFGTVVLFVLHVHP